MLSLPSRERGLKSGSLFRLSRGAAVAPLAGAWIEILLSFRRTKENDVAPLAGAWIEIFNASCLFSCNTSLPSRERGLKYILLFLHSVRHNVAPLAGAWIEIIIFWCSAECTFVAPLAGAWIEIDGISLISTDM